MIFLCPHGQRDGSLCWLCGGQAKVSVVVNWTDADILKFVHKRLRPVAQSSLLNRMDTEHKIALIIALHHLPKANTALTRR